MYEAFRCVECELPRSNPSPGTKQRVSVDGIHRPKSWPITPRNGLQSLKSHNSDREIAHARREPQERYKHLPKR